jgi:hypothetical protein
MTTAGLLLGLLVPAIIIVLTVFAFRPLLRGYREKVANERRADDDYVHWAHPVQADRRKTRAKWFISVGYSASILWLVFSIFSSSQRDAADILSALLLPVALVGINVGLPFAVRAPYAKGQTPSWRRIAMFTLILWAAVLVSFSASGITLGLSAAIFAIAFLTLPTLLWFPVWLLVAFLKQRQGQAP